MIGLTICIPMVIGLFFGWRGARDLPETIPEFGISIAWALAWTAAAVFLWIALVVFSFGPIGMAMLASEAWFGTIVSGLFWLPVVVITYIVRVQSLRRP